MNVFSTQYLAGLTGVIAPVPSFFRTMSFGLEVLSDREEIVIDTKNEKARLTPMVHPLSEAGIVEQEGYSTNIVTPAYLKDKRVFNPNQALARKAGEPIGGALTADQRLTAILADNAQNMANMFDRRIETMCAEAIILGTQTVKGKGFNGTVDFGRSAENEYSAPVAWDHVDANGEYDADILTDFNNAAFKISKNGGGVVGYVAMDTKAYALFAKNRNIRGKDAGWVTSGNARSSVLDPKSLQEGEANYMGMLGAFEVWVYNYTYIDPFDGSSKNVMPDNTVVFVGTNVGGKEHYGAIKDIKAIENGQAQVRNFMKSWVTEDPGVRYVMLQSAPLMVPYRPNATVKLSVV